MVAISFDRVLRVLWLVAAFMLILQIPAAIALYEDAKLAELLLYKRSLDYDERRLELEEAEFRMMYPPAHTGEHTA